MRIATTLLISCALGPAVSAQDLRAPFEAPTILFPRDTAIVAVPDLDADGAPDAVGWYWVNNAFSSIRVQQFRNDGRGNFSPMSSAIIATPAQRWAVGTGRFDRTPGDDYVLVFDRLVVASAPTTWTPPISVDKLVVADFTGDGLDDLVILGSQLQLHRNTGASAGIEFQLAATLAVTGQELAVARLDGDTTPDIVVRDGVNLHALRFASNALTAIATTTYPLNPADQPMLTAGDIDGDGDGDVVVFVEPRAINAVPEYAVWRQTTPGTFALEARVAGGPATGLADIDGDGDLDGVCCGGGGPSPVYNVAESLFHVSINRGAGQFAPAWTIRTVGSKGLAGAVDVDGDGDRDLVAGRTVFFNQSGFRVDPQPDLPIIVTESAPFADYDGDGDLDRFAALDWRADNDGMGNYRSVNPPAPQPPTGTYFHTSMLHGDFDGDGDPDVVASHLDANWQFVGMRLLINRGGVLFDQGPAGAAGQAFNGVGPMPGDEAFAADVDADGDIDLVVWARDQGDGFRVWGNDGRGFFTLVDRQTRSLPAVCVDLDGDGRRDLVSPGHIYFGLGGGRFESSVNLPAASPLRPAVADLDRDGRPDIVAFQSVPGGYQPVVLWNQGARSFAMTPIAIPVPVSGSPAACHVVDLQGDGHLDLVVGSTGQLDFGYGTISIYGDGRRGFADPTVQAFAATRVADVDGDGHDDLLWRDFVRSARPRPPHLGVRRQFGWSTAGLAGVEPRLGATGPFRAGAPITLRLSGAIGGALGVLALGINAAQVPQWPLPGLTGFIVPTAQLTVTVGGNPGVAGDGQMQIPVFVPASLAGASIYHQAFFVDASAPGRVTQTNGLQLTYR